MAPWGAVSTARLNSMTATEAFSVAVMLLSPSVAARGRSRP
jgi:hypothetical protein